MNFNDTETFTLDIVGEQSGQKYFGTFECLRRLTHSKQIARDRIMRDILGPGAQDASPRAKNQAMIIAQLQVCLVKSPDWFKECRYGLDLVDDNVIGELSDRVDDVQVKAVKEVQEKGEEARKNLASR